MTITFNFTEEQEEALREQAAEIGMTLEEAATQALLVYIDQAAQQGPDNSAQEREASHEERVKAAAALIMDNHAEALRRLGE